MSALASINPRHLTGAPGEVTAGFQHEEDWETGQPNGAGTIEPSDEREWFTAARVTHRRKVHTYTGPWEPVTEGLKS